MKSLVLNDVFLFRINIFYAFNFIPTPLIVEMETDESIERILRSFVKNTSNLREA